ncbi:MAG: DUF5908 family protein [Bacteroidota bacterium]|nr:DUF5908 family protein [Bacteroidota bacterium]
MPIEIRELQIKVTVNQSGSPSRDNAQTADGGTHGGDAASPERIIADAVEQVMHILRSKEER